MTTKVEIVKAYGRYLESLANKNTNVFAAYDKMYRYINETVFTLDRNLYQVLLWDSIDKTLKEVKKKGLYFKSMDCEWNKTTVDLFFKYLDNLKKSNDGDESFKINFLRLFKLLRDEESPNVRLYCWSKYREYDQGRRLITSEKDRAYRLLHASTEEEVEAILNEVNNSSTAAQEETRFQDVPNIPPKHLFELFNPKTVDECDADLERLDRMVIDGNINKSQYGVIKDCLILPRRYRYSHGEVYTEPKKVDLNLKIHDATLEESLVLN